MATHLMNEANEEPRRRLRAADSERRKPHTSPPSVTGLVLSVLVTALTWTVVRPHLVITDGSPHATDPFAPPGVGLANAGFVALGWMVLGLGWLVAAPVRRARRAP